MGSGCIGEREKKVQADVFSLLRMHRDALTACKLLGARRRASPRLAQTGRATAHWLGFLNTGSASNRCFHDQAAVLSVSEDCGRREEGGAPELPADLSAIGSRTMDGARPAARETR